MLQAKKKTGLVFFPAFDWAISPTHPEREERLLYTQDQVFEEGLLDIEGIYEYKPDLVTINDVQRVHFCIPDPWKVMTESHFISAGGAKTIGMAVMDGIVERGFAIVRPPGHHACRVVHGARGFCNINVEAIMIEYLRRAYGVKKIAIVDTDCHHGDGTQDIYWHDPNTLFISLHQDGRTLYPGSGFLKERGGPNAVGTTINIPLPPNTSDEGFLYAIKEMVLPILGDFQPELIINSAGQDNHYSDPITNMNLSARGYAEMTTLLQADIAVLEGGYAIEGALPYLNTGIILAMAGLDYDRLIEPDYDADAYRQTREITDYIHQLGDRVLGQWHNREKLTQTVRGMDSPDQRNRSIYYDTDNIQEQQHETIRICDDCGGALRIESSANRQQPIVAVHIPSDACGACKEQGHRWYDTANRNQFANIYLQDRTIDRYFSAFKK